MSATIDWNHIGEGRRIPTSLGPRRQERSSQPLRLRATDLSLCVFSGWFGYGSAIPSMVVNQKVML